MERTGEEKVVKEMYVSKAGESVNGSLQKWAWRDGVREVLGYRGIIIQECLRDINDRMSWGDVAYGAGVNH